MFLPHPREKAEAVWVLTCVINYVLFSDNNKKGQTGNIGLTLFVLVVIYNIVRKQ